MARPAKVAEVQAITDRLRSAQSCVLADYTGLSVAQMTSFRAQCRAANIECRVVKNRLAMIAADQSGLAEIKDHLKGPTALILGTASQVEPAKLAVEFAKNNEALKVKGGVVDGQVLSAEQVVALSKIPSRDELIAKMMGSINSPVTGVVGTVNGVIAALARVIDAVNQQRAEAA
jgi:large subunit ribosomal protein L10